MDWLIIITYFEKVLVFKYQVKYGLTFLGTIGLYTKILIRRPVNIYLDILLTDNLFFLSV